MNVSEAIILVVDDEPELCEIFAAWLARSGCQVLTAANGAEALVTIQSTRVDAIITDIRMPIMDGVTLVRRLHELHLRIPSIIFVSGFGDIDVREMTSLGVEALLTKPVVRHQLLAALSNCLARRSDLWLTPMQNDPEDSIDMALASLADAQANSTMNLGRGGLCLACEGMLPECSVAFAIHLRKEDIVLKGQGYIRWTDPETGHIGLEFKFLDPSTRQFVVETLAEQDPYSYIPRCC